MNEPDWDVWTAGAKERFLAEGAKAERARIREWAEGKMQVADSTLRMKGYIKALDDLLDFLSEPTVSQKQ